MLLNTNHGFFIDREYIADSFFEASQMKALIADAHDGSELAAMFERLRITHVLVSSEEWVSFPPIVWTYLNSPSAARRIYVSPAQTYTIYELVVSDGGPKAPSAQHSGSLPG